MSLLQLSKHQQSRILIFVVGCCLIQFSESAQNYSRNLTENKHGIEMDFTLFSRNKSQQINTSDSESFTNLGLIRGSSLIIFTHGLLESVDSNPSSWNIFKDAYLKEGSTNLILANWSILSEKTGQRSKLPNVKISRNYTKYISSLGSKIASLIINLIDEQVVTSPSEIHLFGQGIGAHIVGAAGYQLQLNYSTKIGRITGLDPSVPYFTSSTTERMMVVLNKSHAGFVDVIHTAVPQFPFPLVGLSSLESFGHVDFYVNGGLASKQTECEFPELPMIISEMMTINCAHLRATSLWAYSISKEAQPLYGCPCKKVRRNTTGVISCQPTSQPVGNSSDLCENEKLQFGPSTSITARGNYYLKIADTTTFGNLFSRNLFQDFDSK